MLVKIATKELIAGCKDIDCRQILARQQIPLASADK
jgi:hypothetical protein